MCVQHSHLNDMSTIVKTWPLQSDIITPTSHYHKIIGVHEWSPCFIHKSPRFFIVCLHDSITCMNLQGLASSSGMLRSWRTVCHTDLTKIYNKVGWIKTWTWGRGFFDQTWECHGTWPQRTEKLQIWHCTKCIGSIHAILLIFSQRSNLPHAVLRLYKGRCQSFAWHDRLLRRFSRCLFFENLFISISDKYEIFMPKNPQNSEDRCQTFCCFVRVLSEFVNFQ